jgi:hypothetical protein
MAGHSKRKRPLGRHRRRLEDNIKKKSERECHVVDWIHEARDTFHWRGRVITAINLQSSIKSIENRDYFCRC